MKPNKKPIKILASYVDNPELLKKNNQQLQLTDFMGFTQKGKSPSWNTICA